MNSVDLKVKSGIGMAGRNGEFFRHGLRDLWEKVLGHSKAILRISRGSARRLHLRESLSLGDRRFVAVVEFEGARFLLGGTPASLALLARLEDAATSTPDRVARGGDRPQLGANPSALKESR
jgi:hypothetical protein